MPPVIAAMWSVGAYLLLLLLTALAEGVREGASLDLVTVTCCFAASYLTITFFILLVHAPESSVRDLLGLRMPDPKMVLLSVLAGAGLAPVVSRLAEWIQHIAPVTPELESASATLFLAHSTAGLAFRFVSQAVIFPVVYELYFRGVLLGAMRRTRPDDVALVMAAMFFAFRDQASIPPMLLIGLVTGWVRLRSGSTFASMGLHVAMMFVWLWPLRADGDFSGDAAFRAPTIAAGMAVSILALGAMWKLSSTNADPKAAA